MKTISNEDLFKRIKDTWKEVPGRDPQDWDYGRQLTNVIGGTHLRTVSLENEQTDEMEWDVFLTAIKAPLFEINAEQLCMIFDEGNHCVSEGSVFYEEDIAFLTWSNRGHI